MAATHSRGICATCKVGLPLFAPAAATPLAAGTVILDHDKPVTGAAAASRSVLVSIGLTIARFKRCRCAPGGVGSG